MFTQEELYWLDDLLPGSKKAKELKLSPVDAYLIDENKVVQKVVN